MTHSSESQADAAPSAPLQRRRTRDELEQEIALLSSHGLTDALLQAFGGVVMILNAQRQIIAVNVELLPRLGVKDPGAALGKRPGEVFDCMFANEGQDGCGTDPTCASCGAAIAILACQHTGETAERECYITACSNGEERHLEFRARCTPLPVDAVSFYVLTLQDIRSETQLQQWHGLFLHDVLNLLTSASFCADELRHSDGADRTQRGEQLCQLLQTTREIARAERDMLKMEAGAFQPELADTSFTEIVDELRRMWEGERLLQGRLLTLPQVPMDLNLYTDRRLLLRVITNMLSNALEATPQGGQVRVRYRLSNGVLVFEVSNPGELSPVVAARVFQRSFTTKTGSGHGLGAYSMKLIGERYLGGQISFTSGESGTSFRFAIPLNRELDPPLDA